MAAPPNANFADIGKAFVEHYYREFDSNRANLAALYRDNSMLTFEAEQFLGMQSIMTKLTTLKFQTVQHQPTTIDAQPTLNNGIVVFVTGNLAVDGNVSTPLKYAQTFCLYPTPEGGWYLHNDLFRLNYC